MSDLADDSDGAESRRKRIRQACLNCRRKKVRCRGEKPTCNFCSRLSQPCVYVEDGRSQRRGSASLHAGYDETTEAVLDAVSSRFSALEDRLSRIESAIERLTSLPLLSSITALPDSQEQQSPERLDTSCQQQAPTTPADASVTIPESQAVQDGRALPPIHTLLFAADVYFRFCHNQPYSLFHEPTFRRRLVSGNVPAYLVWALLSAVRRYSTLPDLYLKSEDDAMVYAARAWECLNLPWNGVSKDEEAIPVIQAIVLMVNTEHPASDLTANIPSNKLATAAITPVPDLGPSIAAGKR